jgi:hypothetical protein
MVVGREPSLDGPLSVGWALDENTGESAGEPRPTITFREALLVDGMVRARASEREHMTRRTSRTLVGFGVVGTAFLLTVLLRLWVARRELENVEDVDLALEQSNRSVARPVRSEDEALGIPIASSSRAFGWLLFLAISLFALGVWVWTRLS